MVASQGSALWSSWIASPSIWDQGDDSSSRRGRGSFPRIAPQPFSGPELDHMPVPEVLIDQTPGIGTRSAD